MIEKKWPAGGIEMVMLQVKGKVLDSYVTANKNFYVFWGGTLSHFALDPLFYIIYIKLHLP